MLLLLITLPFLGAASHAEDRLQIGSKTQGNITVGYSAMTFVNIDMNDAQAAAKLWTETIAKKAHLTAQSSVYADLPMMEQELKSRKIDIAILVSNEYLDLSQRVALEPLAEAADDRGTSEEVLLIVRKDSPFRKISDLKQRQLIMVKGQHSVIQLAWLETKLMRGGVSKVHNYFSSIKETNKTSQACLPVFFKKADACIVRRSGFDTMVELNPQLGREFLVLATSEKILGGIIAARRELSEDKKRAVRDLLMSLHADPDGRQLLTLFGMNRLVPFEPAYLDHLANLIQEYRQLKRRYAKTQ